MYRSVALSTFKSVPISPRLHQYCRGLVIAYIGLNIRRTFPGFLQGHGKAGWQRPCEELRGVRWPALHTLWGPVGPTSWKQSDGRNCYEVAGAGPLPQSTISQDKATLLKSWEPGGPRALGHVLPLLSSGWQSESSQGLQVSSLFCMDLSFNSQKSGGKTYPGFQR